MVEPSSDPLFHVVAELSPWQGYYRPVLRGVLRYAAGAADWELHSTIRQPHVPSAGAPATPEAVDGRIIPAMNRHFESLAERRPQRMVAVRDRFEQDRTPTVVPDNRAVGAMAAEYMLALGFRRFAMVGAAGNHAAQRRLAGFEATASEAGASIETMPEGAGGGDAGAPTPSPGWLSALKPPCGMFCWTDETAYNAIRAAKAAGLNLPDDLAVMGVHNDDLICEAIRPSITSVALPLERVGYEAAALLDRLLRGEPAPTEPLRLPPVEVVERSSTRTGAIENPAVAQAMGIIRQRAVRGLTVEELCGLMSPPISRRTLERRFEEHFGRSPHEQIRHQQCQHARELLVNSSMRQEEIARRCGFSSTPFFSNTFNRIVGQRPGEYRKARLDR